METKNLHNIHIYRYDSHLIFKQLTQNKDKVEPQVIAKSMEKFVSFSIKNLHFKDSLQFLNSSLETLVKNLKSKQKNGKKLEEIFPNLYHYFKNNWAHIPEKEFHLLTRKLCYPYKYIDGFEKFEITAIPPREEFFNDITQKNISLEDYSFVQEVWTKFKLKNLGQLHDLYVGNDNVKFLRKPKIFTINIFIVTDCILLSDVFERFRSFSLKNYFLDPAHFISAPSLAWMASLFITKQTLEIPSDR